MKAETELFTLRLKVVDKPGVLVRVALVFSRRGRNVSTLLVSPSLTPGFSSIMVSFHTVEDSVPGIKAQLEKLVDVLEVESTPVGR
jgi:acetolactate synthase-1/3 small subunit